MMTCLQAGARQVDEEDSAAGKAFQHKLLTQTEWINHIVRCPAHFANVMKMTSCSLKAANDEDSEEEPWLLTLNP